MENFKPTRQTMLVIVPPEDCIQRIDVIRSKYDKSYQRKVLPHISIFNEFVPKPALYNAFIKLKYNEKFSKLKPFKIQLNKLESNDDSKYVYLKPEIIREEKDTKKKKDEPIIEDEFTKIFNICVETFPQCKNSFTGSKFSPHLTIAQIDQKEKRRWMKEMQKQWTNMEFEVNELHLVSRPQKDEYMTIYYSVKLGCDPNEY